MTDAVAMAGPGRSAGWPAAPFAKANPRAAGATGEFALLVEGRAEPGGDTPPGLAEGAAEAEVPDGSRPDEDAEPATSEGGSLPIAGAGPSLPAAWSLSSNTSSTEEPGGGRARAGVLSGGAATAEAQGTAATQGAGRAGGLIAGRRPEGVPAAWAVRTAAPAAAGSASTAPAVAAPAVAGPAVAESSDPLPVSVEGARNNLSAVAAGVPRPAGAEVAPPPLPALAAEAEVGPPMVRGSAAEMGEPVAPSLEGARRGGVPGPTEPAPRALPADPEAASGEQVLSKADPGQRARDVATEPRRASSEMPRAPLDEPRVAPGAPPAAGDPAARIVRPSRRDGGAESQGGLVAGPGAGTAGERRVSGLAVREPAAASPFAVREPAALDPARSSPSPYEAPAPTVVASEGAAPPIHAPGLGEGPRTARHIARQVAEQPVLRTGGAAELNLYPEELGHLRLTVEGGEGQLRVIIEAARPETADLLRRHAEALRQELRQEGLGSVSVSIGGGEAKGRDGAPARREGESGFGGSGTGAAGPAEPGSARAPALAYGSAARGRAAGGHIDLRF